MRKGKQMRKSNTRKSNSTTPLIWLIQSLGQVMVIRCHYK